MSIEGIVYERQESVLADVEVTESESYKVVHVIRDGEIVISFPLAKTVDINEIALRTGNVINQTGLVANPVRVELSETV